MNNKEYLKKILSANIHVEDEKLEEALNELGTPITDKPHQQLVTGEDGVPKWENRTGYKGLSVVEVVPEATAAEFEPIEESGTYWCDFSADDTPAVLIREGTICTVVWDGVEYTVAAGVLDEGYYVGEINLTKENGASLPHEYPFFIHMSPMGVGVTALDSNPHTLSVFAEVETIVPIPAEYLPNVIFDLKNRTCNVDFDTFVSVLQGGGIFTIITRYYDDSDDPRYDAERAIPIYFEKSDEMPGYNIYYLNQSGNVGHFVYNEMGAVMVAT